MNYQRQVLPIVKEAGDALRPYFGNVAAVSQKTDDSWDVVTELDKKQGD